MKIRQRKNSIAGVMLVWVAAVFLAASMVPSGVAAAPWSDEPGKRGGMSGKRHHGPLGIWRNQQVIEQLELTQEQVGQLRDAEFSSREKRLELKTRADQLRLQMDKAFSLETRDKKTVRQLAQQMADVKGQLFVQKIEDRLVLETILTPDQIQELKSNAMQRKKREPRIGQRDSGRGRLAGRFDDGDCRRVQ